MQVSDSNDLIPDLVAGKEAAFELLYDRLGPRLLRVARTIAGSHADAEDVVQDAFVCLVRMGAKLAPLKNLEAYMFATVQHAAIARASLRRRDKPIDELLHRPAETEFAPPGAERLDRALEALPADQRAVVALKIDGGLTFEEIAAALQISTNTAASRYRYALEKLRCSMKQSRTMRHIVSAMEAEQ